MSAGPPNDTHPKIEALLIEGYRKMSSSQKLARVCALTQAVQQFALMDVRRRHPKRGRPGAGSPSGIALARAGADGARLRVGCP